METKIRLNINDVHFHMTWIKRHTYGRTKGKIESSFNKQSRKPFEALSDMIIEFE